MKRSEEIILTEHDVKSALYNYIAKKLKVDYGVENMRYTLFNGTSKADVLHDTIKVKWDRKK